MRIIVGALLRVNERMIGLADDDNKRDALLRRPNSYNYSFVTFVIEMCIMKDILLALCTKELQMRSTYRLQFKNFQKNKL